MRKAADKRLTTPALMAAVARPSLILGGAIGHVSSVLGGSGLVRLRLTRPFLSPGAVRLAERGLPLVLGVRDDRSRRGSRSGAGVGREVLAGEGGAGGDEVGGCALEDDPAAVVAGAGAEVDDPV